MWRVERAKEKLEKDLIGGRRTLDGITKQNRKTQGEERIEREEKDPRRSKNRKRIERPKEKRE